MSCVRELVVPVGTREFLYESINVVVADPGADLGDAPVTFALVAAGLRPASDDWQPGGWFTDENGKLWARVLLGDTIPLSQGIFDGWIRTDLGDEEPERCFARLYVS